MRILFSTLMITVALAPVAFAGNTCIRNQTEDQFHFTVDEDGGARATADLQPGGVLCLSDDRATGMATVAVFAHPTDLEGCSRRVPSDSVAALLSFPGVDQCSWRIDAPG